ncbi:hypothetical protein FEM48_Zijuj04G0128000 [Ziziphus jujuba var. spinosa]|uniref:Protein IQ-DOMAIN 1 n=1 Tax=Ziziphus jujuba var. spinosa TaxID=714518 RepID=A0A978VJZ3_ZIZJJ|nr:hypothetical protein FEM48_Zijuj04G0128000 [Ziziphus jujuba var. spinosa]
MGITRGLVRIVFTKNRSAGVPDSHAKSNVIERKRWNSVRSYLCGDEYNSVLAEEDSASVKSSGVTVTQFNSNLEEEDSGSVRSSEATVTQPLPADLAAKDGVQGDEEAKEDIQVQKHDSSVSKIMHEDQAAITIQSAFRGFLVRCKSEGNRSKGGEEETVNGVESPNRESLGTSIEVQTGNSVEIPSAQEERMAVHNRTYKKARTQVTKLKEDWDDSTVSSNISKMRIQNRLEATTRRERALAYAFSQQLRICSKKRQAKSDGTEPDMGWSWLERWMATRLPESSSVESRINMQMEPSKCKQKFMISKKLFDVAVEEKESCGSNEVSVSFDSFSVGAAKGKDGLEPSYRFKATRTVSRRKSAPDCQYARGHVKVDIILTKLIVIAT